MSSPAATQPNLRRGGFELVRASEALAELGRYLAPAEAGTFLAVEDALSDWRTPRTAADLGTRFPALLRAAQARLGSTLERSTFNRALVADLASRLRFRLDELVLPTDVKRRIPPALDRLHSFLSEEQPGYELGDDHFLRDVRFAAGWTVPCGSEVIDLRTHVSLPASALIALKARAPRLALRRLMPGEPVAWFSPHTDSRYLDEFDEAGWERTYLNVASLLSSHADVAGIAAYSWFFDPQLEEISPRLNYLRQRPLQGGALLMRGHTSQFDVKNATAKSPTRRRLYEAGEYVPVAHRMVWLRRDILSWAEIAQRPPG
jgi:hypothetical protein